MHFIYLNLTYPPKCSSVNVNNVQLFAFGTTEHSLRIGTEKINQKINVNSFWNVINEKRNFFSTIKNQTSITKCEYHSLFTIFCTTALKIELNLRLERHGGTAS